MFLIRYLNPINKKSPKIRNVHKKDYGKIEKQSNISIDSIPFVYEDETLYLIYTLKQPSEKYINLLLLTNFKNSHYVLIKDFD